MTKYEYATRDIDKIEQAKATIEQQAAARKQTILGWNVYTADDHPRLQEHTPGVMHLFVEGYTTQAEVATLPPAALAAGGMTAQPQAAQQRPDA